MSGATPGVHGPGGPANRPARDRFGLRAHRATLLGTPLGFSAHSNQRARGTPTLPPGGVCDKCKGALTVDGLDTAVLACVYCGKRFY